MLQKFFPKEDKPALPKEALEFQPDAEELELTPLPRLARLTLHCILALFLILLVWACFAQTDKIIPASGKIVSSGKNIIIAPLQDAIIRSINVRLGETVKKGEVLAHLDPTFSTADATRLQKTKTYDSLMLARLQSELSGSPFLPPASASSSDIATQHKLLAGRLEEFTAKLRAYNTKISQKQHDIQALQQQYVQMDKQVSVAKELVGMRVKVYEAGSDSRLSLLEAENHLAETNVSMEQLKGQLESARHEVTQLLAEKEAFIENWRNDIVSQITLGNKDLQSVEEDLSKAERLKDLTTLTAPSDAVVLDIANFNPGTVVKSGDAFMTLVPLDAPWKPPSSSIPTTSATSARATQPRSNSIPIPIRNTASSTAPYGPWRKTPKPSTPARDGNTPTRDGCASRAWTICGISPRTSGSCPA